MRAEDLMTRSVVTVRPGTPAKEAARLLVDRGFTALPVVDDEDRLLGVVTEHDLLRNRLLPDPRALVHGEPPEPVAPASPSVAEVMTTDVVTAAPTTHATALSRMMLDRRVRSVPVLSGDRLLGIVTRRDLLRSIARDDRTIARDVGHQLAIAGCSRWEVAVTDGVVDLAGGTADETDRHVAKVVAGAVPGVVEVRVADRAQV